MIKLFIKQGLSFEEMSTDKDVAVVGRSADCDIVIDQNGLSRQHCEIRISPGQADIIDRGSRNGVVLNGEKIEERASIQPGDMVRLGECVFYYGEKPAGADDPVFLEIIAGPDTGRRLDVGRDSIVIGRKDCDFILDKDDGISSRHALIELGPTGYIVKDLGSRNGVYLAANKVQTISLRDNHVFRLGKTVLFFGTQRELNEVQNKKVAAKRNLILQRKLPTIAAVLVIVTLVLMLVFRPDQYIGGKENLLGSNPSFEKVRSGTALPAHWGLDFRHELDGKVIKDNSSGQGEFAFQVIGEQAALAGESRLHFETAFPKTTSVVSFSAMAKTALNGGLVQLGLQVGGNGKSAILRGPAVCGTSTGYQKLEQIFVLPDWVEQYQPAIVFFSIDGRAWIDGVALHEESDTLTGITVYDLKNGNTALSVYPDGSFNYMLNDAEIFVEGKLYLPDPTGVSHSGMGYIASPEYKPHTSEFSGNGKIYSFQLNEFVDYKIRLARDGKGWKVNYTMPGEQEMAFAFRIPSEFASIEAFGINDELVEITDKVPTSAVREITLTNNSKGTVFRHKDRLSILTHEIAGSLLTSSDGGSIFPVNLVSGSPRLARRVKTYLEQAKGHYEAKRYSQAIKMAKAITGKYGDFELEAKDAQLVLDQIDKRAKESLKLLLADAKVLKPEDPDMIKRINQFAEKSKKAEAQFAGMPVSVEMQSMREDIVNKMKAARLSRQNAAADKLVKQIEARLVKEEFAMVEILIGNLDQQYPGTTAHSRMAGLMDRLKQAKEIVKEREAYVKKRYAEANNFLKNDLTDPAKKVFQDILVRYPNHTETQNRLKELE